MLGLPLRLFTGLSLPPETNQRIANLLGELRPAAPVKWTPPENLHITLRFIGAWPDDQLAPLEAALSQVPASRPIQINLAHFGFFPNAQRPGSFYADVHAGPGLADLGRAIDQALKPLGYLTESRAYRPHVTLARIKSGTNLNHLHNHLAAMSDFDFGSFEAREFHLYRSTPAPSGSIYSTLATYHLMKEHYAPQ